jgi:hypothetical protein
MQKSKPLFLLFAMADCRHIHSRAQKGTFHYTIVRLYLFFSSTSLYSLACFFDLYFANNLSLENNDLKVFLFS